MSRTSLYLRAVTAAASLVLLLLALIAGTGMPAYGIATIVVLTVLAVIQPDSWWALALLACHGIGWATTTPLPAGPGDWLLLLAGAVCALVLHLTAAWAASVPPSARAPRALVLRWGRAGAIIAALTLVPWLAAWASSGVEPAAALLLSGLVAVTLGGAAYAIARAEQG